MMIVPPLLCGFLTLAAAARAPVTGGNTLCWDEQRSATPPILGRMTPVCDHSGGYLPRQCHGSVCYCTDATGAQIDRYQSVGRGHNISCNCAREVEELRTSLIVGPTINCDEYGDYTVQQCTGSVCHCVDTVTGQQNDRYPSVPIYQLDTLQCTDAELVLGGDTPCWDQQRLYETSPPLPGRLRPDCDLIGQYKSAQCSGSQCYCVDAAGSRLHQYQSLSRADPRTLACNCAREVEELRTSLLVGPTINCDEYGDYTVQQCTGSVCHCVDTVTGQQNDRYPSVPIYQLDTLQCI